MTAIDLVTAAATDLAQRLDSGLVHIPTGVPSIWNAAVQRRPALVCGPERHAECKRRSGPPVTARCRYRCSAAVTIGPDAGCATAAW